MISALSDQPSWEQRCNEHLSMPQTLSQVLRKQPRTQENAYLQKASISVLNVAPCPCLWRAHPSFLKLLSPLSPFLHPPIILQLLTTIFLLQPLPRKNSNKHQQLPYVHNIQQMFIWSSFYLSSVWKVTPLWFSSFINSLPQHTFFWKWLLLLLNI